MTQRIINKNHYPHTLAQGLDRIAKILIPKEQRKEKEEMPNWCKNNLRIYSNGEKVLEVLELLKDENGEMTFRKFMPMPKELEDTVAPSSDDEKAIAERRKKYGAADWYEWHNKYWGCKWDAQDSNFHKEGDDWVVSFSTPWGPPIPFLEKLSEKFNKMTFVLQYADEFEGNSPLGEATFEDGCVGWNNIDEEGESKAILFANAVWGENWVDDINDLKEEDE